MHIINARGQQQGHTRENRGAFLCSDHCHAQWVAAIHDPQVGAPGSRARVCAPDRHYTLLLPRPHPCSTRLPQGGEWQYQQAPTSGGLVKGMSPGSALRGMGTSGSGPLGSCRQPTGSGVGGAHYLLWLWLTGSQCDWERQDSR